MASSLGFLGSAQEFKAETPIVKDEFTHALCIGETGSGKTTGFILPNIKDRIAKKHGILVYDFKGNLHLGVKKLALDAGRLGDVIEIGTPWGKKTNPFEYMTIKEIYALLFALISQKDTEGVFWHSAAATLGSNIVRIIRRIGKVRESFEQLGIEFPKLFFRYSVDFNDKISKIEHASMPVSDYHAEEFEYPTSASFASLYSCVRTVKKLCMFTDGHPMLVSFLKDKLISAFAAKMKKEFANQNIESEWPAVQKGFEEAMLRIEELDNSFAMLDSYKSMAVSISDDFSGNYGVIFSLESSLKHFYDYSFFSEHECDIIEELNAGKIVVVNTSLLTNQMINALNQSIVLNLSKRAKQPRKTPVSIFIDEANRVVDKNTELATDILREAKVELILAIQNESQMIYKMGIDRYKELKGNLTEQIIFRSNDENHMQKTDKDVERLATHTYLSGELKEIKSTQPIFFGEDELLGAEYEYQKSLPIVSELLSMNKVTEPTIAVFDDIVFERDDSVYLENIKTKEIKKIIFRSDSEYKNARKELAKIYKYVFGDEGEEASAADKLGFISRWRKLTRDFR
jgi:hypothetical protein